MRITEYWYFVSKIVLKCCEKKKCFSDQEKLFKFETEGREFAIFLRFLELFIRTVQSLKPNVFLTCSLRFFRLEQKNLN